MPFKVSANVLAKLASKVPPVTIEEIEQCFATRSGGYLYDTREDHASDPPTLWFVSETYYGRKLKVIFIPKEDGITIRSAYDPNKEEIRIYEKYSTS